LQSVHSCEEKEFKEINKKLYARLNRSLTALISGTCETLGKAYCLKYNIKYDFEAGLIKRDQYMEVLVLFYLSNGMKANSCDLYEG